MDDVPSNPESKERFSEEKADKMSVYKRVNCPQCAKYVELRNGDDKLKKMTCPRCGNLYSITVDNAVYYIDYSVGYKRYREKVGPSKTFAESVLAKRLTEITENKFFDVRRDEKIRFEDFADEYLDLHCKVNNKSWLASDFRNLTILKRFFSGRYLHEINPHLIEKFKMDRIKEGVAPATVNRQLATLKCLFNKAIAWQKFSEANPKCPVRLFKENNKRKRFLELDEVTKLLV
ncbi:MAG: hypothetical protein HQK96_19145, partial [Nitrospirae bacterium]|nr:hypothetical protein [Nitrospirota bacterium]